MEKLKKKHEEWQTGNLKRVAGECWLCRKLEVKVVASLQTSLRQALSGSFSLVQTCMEHTHSIIVRGWENGEWRIA
jgi:hypothetical protein